MCKIVKKSTTAVTVVAVTDPDIRLGRPNHVADPDILAAGGANLICFPVSRLYLCWRGPKSITKLDRGAWPDFPLDPPLW